MAIDTSQRAAAPAAGLQLTHRQILVIFSGLMLGMFLAALDQTIVATALPRITGDLGGLNHLSWVITAYLLATTISTPLYGKLGDQYGRKIFFQAAIVIFLVGSVLAGLAQGMTELIAFRAVQGLGAGGLMVGAQAIIADIVSPRERGRYMGYFGAVFGLSSVAGPLLGGFFTDSLSWRWVFYINVPLGLAALVVTALVLPRSPNRTKHTIDYLGFATLAAAISCLILLTTLGGTTYAWGSPQIIGLGIAGVALLGIVAVVERRAAEPVLPPALFGNRVFSVSSGIGFIVGFALFGAVSFLPLFLQVVNGASATRSGLQLVPLMVGLLVTSIASGRAISRTGRYKRYPIVGTACIVLALYLLSTMTASTTIVVASVYMLVLGIGLGLTMQVLVLAVQNAVAPRDIGAATSAATFFRSMGGSFGVAIFGAIFTNRLAVNLPQYLPASAHGLSGAIAAATRDPSRLRALPADVHAGFLEAFTRSLSPAFLAFAGVAVIAFALTWLLREVPLRTTSGMATLEGRETVPPEAMVPPEAQAAGVAVAAATDPAADMPTRRS